jgi:hypothetical protein
MPDRVVPRELQHIVGADDVRADIAARLVYRIAHAGLRGEVDHRVGLERRPGRAERVIVFDRDAGEGECRVIAEDVGARFL